MDPMAIAGVATALIELVIRLVGPEQAKNLLDKSAVNAANKAADAAEEAKFG